MMIGGEVGRQRGAEGMEALVEPRGGLGEARQDTYRFDMNGDGRIDGLTTGSTSLLYSRGRSRHSDFLLTGLVPRGRLRSDNVGKGRKREPRYCDAAVASSLRNTKKRRWRPEKGEKGRAFSTNGEETIPLTYDFEQKRIVEEQELINITRERNEAVRLRPMDVQAWLNLAALQDDEIEKLASRQSRGLAERMALLSKKTAVLERGLEELPQNEALILELMRTIQQGYAGSEERGARWDAMLRKNSDKVELWKEYISQTLSSNFSDFTVAGLEAVIGRALRALRSKWEQLSRDGGKEASGMHTFEQGMKNMLCRLLQLQIQSGHHARAVAFLQATLDYTCCSGNIDSQMPASRRKRFQVFWNNSDRQHRIGGEAVDVAGWMAASESWSWETKEVLIKGKCGPPDIPNSKNHHTVEPMLLKQKGIDEEEEEDADSESEFEATLRREMGLRIASIDENRVSSQTMLKWIEKECAEERSPDSDSEEVRFDEIECCLLDISEDSRVDFARQLLRVFGISVPSLYGCFEDTQSVLNSSDCVDESLLGDAFSAAGELRFSVPEWLNLTRRSSLSAPDSECEQRKRHVFFCNVLASLASWLNRLEFRDAITVMHKKNIPDMRKMSKEALARHGHSIQLWTRHLLIETYAGNLKGARKVYETTLRMRGELNQEECSWIPCLALAASTAEMGTRGSASRCINLLILACGIEVNIDSILSHEEIESACQGGRRKVQKVFERLQMRNSCAIDERDISVAVAGFTLVVKGGQAGASRAFALYNDVVVPGLENLRKGDRLESAYDACSHMMAKMLQALLADQASSLSPQQEHDALMSALKFFPSSPEILGLLLKSEKYNNASSRLRTYFMHASVDSISVAVAAFATKGAGGDVFARRLFEAIVEAKETKASPSVWRWYLRFETKVDSVRRLFYRAIKACPWSKALWMDGFHLLLSRGEGGLTDSENAELMLIAAEKGIRFSVDIYSEQLREVCDADS